MVSEFWLGLKALSSITSRGTWELIVELEDFKNKSYIAMYHRFKVESSPLYRLSVSGYDSLASSLTDSLTTHHNGQAFTTPDRDNDICTSQRKLRCLTSGRHRKCHSSNLNGYNFNRGDLPHEPDYYADGIIWHNSVKVAEQDYYFSWPKVEMKIKKKGC